jgi:H+/Cl- antiporter ClcA
MGVWMANPADTPVDPDATIRSKSYGVLLILAAIVGVVVSLVAWGFLELAHWIPEWVFEDLPEGLGFDNAPTWWPIPVLVAAGLIVAFAIERLPGRGGHVPSEGLKSGVPRIVDLLASSLPGWRASVSDWSSAQRLLSSLSALASGSWPCGSPGRTPPTRSGR